MRDASFLIGPSLVLVWGQIHPSFIFQFTAHLFPFARSRKFPWSCCFCIFSLLLFVEVALIVTSVEQSISILSKRTPNFLLLAFVSSALPVLFWTWLCCSTDTSQLLKCQEGREWIETNYIVGFRGIDHSTSAWSSMSSSFVYAYLAGWLSDGAYSDLSLEGVAHLESKRKPC